MNIIGAAVDHDIRFLYRRNSALVHRQPAADHIIGISINDKHRFISFFGIVHCDAVTAHQKTAAKRNCLFQDKGDPVGTDHASAHGNLNRFSSHRSKCDGFQP